MAKFKSKQKIVEILNRYSAVQTVDVTIISYKPQSDLNFARYTQYYRAVACPLLLWSLKALAVT